MNIELVVMLSDDIRAAARELSTLRRQATTPWDRRVYSAARNEFVRRYGHVPFDDSQDDIVSGWWWYRHYLKGAFNYDCAVRVLDAAKSQFVRLP